MIPNSQWTPEKPSPLLIVILLPTWHFRAFQTKTFSNGSFLFFYFSSIDNKSFCFFPFYCGCHGTQQKPIKSFNSSYTKHDYHRYINAIHWTCSREIKHPHNMHILIPHLVCMCSSRATNMPRSRQVESGRGRVKVGSLCTMLTRNEMIEDYNFLQTIMKL